MTEFTTRAITSQSTRKFDRTDGSKPAPVVSNMITKVEEFTPEQVARLKALGDSDDLRVAKDSDLHILTEKYRQVVTNEDFVSAVKVAEAILVTAQPRAAMSLVAQRAYFSTRSTLLMLTA